MNNIEETLNVLNNFTGENTLSSEYIQLLNNYNLQETDGYIIKLKLNDEVLSQKQRPQSVIPRLYYLIEQLSQRRCYDNHILEHEEKLIIYLENQQDNKIICEKCGCQLQFTDKYCYSCGRKQKTKISIIELLSGINSTYIKPGDIIRINTDNTIDKTSYNPDEKRIKHKKVEEDISLLQYEQINRYNLEQFYKRILILNYIKKNHNPYQLIQRYPQLDYEQITDIIDDMLNENFIEKTLNDSIRDVSSKINNNDNNTYYHLTPTGQMLLQNNMYIIFYYEVIYDTVSDDIIEFERLYKNRSSTETLESISVKLINKLRKKYLDENMHSQFNQTFNHEAYINELFAKSYNKILVLLKRFIINVNLNYGYNMTTPLDTYYIDYLQSVIKSENITQDMLKDYLHKAYETQTDEYIKIGEDEVFNILIRSLEGYDINNLNFEIIKLYNSL